MVRQIFLLGLGLCLLVLVGWSLRSSFSVGEKATEASVSAEPALMEVPVRVTIPQISVDLPLTPGLAEGGNWEVAKKGASFLANAGAGRVGRGNLVVYGHARPAIFLPLKKIKAGDKIYVRTNLGFWVFEAESTRTVPPSETGILEDQGVAYLTLFTCIDFKDSQRFVVRAKLVESRR